MSNKLCFVLGAGGARGVAHIGFLQAMEEFNIKPDCIVGCSMGAVVGACYSAGFSPKEMKEIAESLKPKHIIDISPALFSRKSLLTSVKMQRKIGELLGDTTFDQLKIPFECIAVDLHKGKVVTLNQGSVAEAVRASAAIPTVFRPVIKDDQELVDGGVLCRVPVENAKHFKADKVIAVDVLGEYRPHVTSKNIIEQALRIVELSDSHSAQVYLKQHKPDILIKPNLGDMSQYKVEKLSFAYGQGYHKGVKYAESIIKLRDEVK